MKYEEALRAWGKIRLEAAYNTPKKTTVIDANTVEITMDFKEGYACCGGTDPQCYCSFFESPSANVAISGRDTNGDHFYTSINMQDFDFSTVLKEIVEAGDGSITS